MPKYIYTSEDLMSMQYSCNNPIMFDWTKNNLIPKKDMSHNDALIRDIFKIKINGKNYPHHVTQQVSEEDNIRLDKFLMDHLKITDIETIQRLKESYSQAIPTVIKSILTTSMKLDLESFFPKSISCEFSMNIQRNAKGIYLSVTYQPIKIFDPSDEIYTTIPGAIMSTFKLTEDGFRLHKLNISNSLLNKLCFGNFNVDIEPSDIQEAKAEELDLTIDLSNQNFKDLKGERYNWTIFYRQNSQKGIRKQATNAIQNFMEKDGSQMQVKVIEFFIKKLLTLPLFSQHRDPKKAKSKSGEPTSAFKNVSASLYNSLPKNAKKDCLKSINTIGKKWYGEKFEMDHETLTRIYQMNTATTAELFATVNPTPF